MKSFSCGTTEAINLIAKSRGVQNVGEGDEIIVSHFEHHANIVPWQQLAAQTGAKLRVIPVDDSGFPPGAATSSLRCLNLRIGILRWKSSGI